METRGKSEWVESVYFLKGVPVMPPNCKAAMLAVGRCGKKSSCPEYALPF